MAPYGTNHSQTWAYLDRKMTNSLKSNHLMDKLMLWSDVRDQRLLQAHSAMNHELCSAIIFWRRNGHHSLAKSTLNNQPRAASGNEVMICHWSWTIHKNSLWTMCRHFVTCFTVIHFCQPTWSILLTSLTTTMINIINHYRPYGLILWSHVARCWSFTPKSSSITDNSS